MPRLTDTAWRVLTVILRTTVGWNETGGRKRRDWLTNAQLRRRTGRSSEAVSNAIDALVRAGLISVTGSAGELLATPAARRRYRGCLFYEVTATELSTYPPRGRDGSAANRKPERRNN
jgi:phage replication O-like protein O